MRSFRFETASDATTATALLAERPEAKLLGGGTNLIDLMRLGVEQPETVVDVTRLGLDDIESLNDGALRIGASVRNSDLAADVRVRTQFPVLSQALLAGASGQLRNMATTAGNLLQRTRCVYFQDVSKPCNKREPGSGCPAIHGDHRNLAIFGASESCVATHPSDMAVALAALDAVVHVQSSTGVRAIAIDQLHRLPGDTPDVETMLAHDEIITSVVVPALSPGTLSSYRKVRDRASYAFALASVALVVTAHDGVIDDARIGLGGVAAKPWRARRAEDVLRGAPVTAESFQAAAEAEIADARSLENNQFKLPLVRQIVVAALTELLTPEEQS
jgi:xanthine dehydrogenase YagS FAD-binding subunit